MDTILDILIQKDDVDKINIRELLNEWGGKQYSCEPPKFMFGSELVFHQSVDMNYYKDLVLDEYDIDNSIALTLEGKSLSELEYGVNRKKELLFNSELLSFLRIIFDSLKSVCIIKLRDEEMIDNNYQVEDTDSAMKIFLNSLDWESPKGIIITKKNK